MSAQATAKHVSGDAARVKAGEGADEGVDEGTAGDGEDGGGEGEDVDMEVDVRVQKVLRHHVYGGARPGSLHNVYVKLLFEDGSCTVGGVEPSEPLAQSESGRAALSAYVKTKNGMKIAKYVPF